MLSFTMARLIQPFSLAASLSLAHPLSGDSTKASSRTGDVTVTIDGTIATTNACAAVSMISASSVKQNPAGRKSLPSMQHFFLRRSSTNEWQQHRRYQQQLHTNALCRFHSSRMQATKCWWDWKLCCNGNLHLITSRIRSLLPPISFPA